MSTSFKLFIFSLTDLGSTAGGPTRRDGPLRPLLESQRARKASSGELCFRSLSITSLIYNPRFNEPDLGGEANILPAMAANLWTENMEPFYGKAALISPAISNGGTVWMSYFLGNCSTCHFSAVATHWQVMRLPIFCSRLLICPKKLGMTPQQTLDTSPSTSLPSTIPLGSQFGSPRYSQP